MYMQEDSYLNGKAKKQKPMKYTDKEKSACEFVEAKKKEMKESQYRKRFDTLYQEIKTNLVNTAVTYGEKKYESNGWGSMVVYNKTNAGYYDINVYPQKMANNSNNQSGVPTSFEPIAFSKILIATSVLAGKLPDATVIADDKVYARASYELWKRSWTNNKANGTNTLMISYQNLFTYGWAAWRVYPRRVEVPRKGVQKIIFDDVYREPMDPARTWLGAGFNNFDLYSRGEVYYEKDILKEEFFEMMPKAKEYKSELEYATQEATDENNDKGKTHVTLGYYENWILNKYIVKCGKFIIYEGELPNDDSYGSVVVARCFMRDMNDPHGVGLYELMRGNTALYQYLNSLNAQQIEAEIFPIIFGSQVQNGTATYKRGPNIINPKHPGTSIDIVRTTGNVSGGIGFADKQKINIEENTGINNIVAGQNAESTLGSTVILKEAAYNRLTPARNSMVDALTLDAQISHSWIKQTYTVDKVFMVDSDDKVAEFAKQNPDYFVESQPIIDDEQNITGYAIAASPNIRIDFDFTPEGEMLEKQPTRTISAKALFTEMETYGHKSDYIDFVIDPDSMLLPSMEIQKQTFMALFPVITNQITLIFSLRNTDPDAAASQLMSLEQLLEIQNQNIYDYIPKADYDAIIAKQPSAVQMQMQEMQMMEQAKGNALNNMVGGGGMEGGMSSGQEMSADGTDPLQPQNANEVPRPQSPLGASVDASVGQAANLPFFPN